MKKQILLKSVIAVMFLTTALHQETRSQQTSTMTDNRDGKIYKTVTIGNQTWMAENLDYATNYGSWCYNNNNKNCEKFGKLYNWETAKDGCPSGWHLPSEAELDLLIKYLGGWEVAGAKLKSNSYWRTKHDSLTNYAYVDVDDDAGPNATTKRDSILINSSNFNGLAGGGYYIGNIFDYIGRYGTWWTTSKFNEYNSCYYYIYDKSSGMGKYHALNTCGFSVRCIKN
jgi:uncharacterized protein (TIGR02145 family)